MVRTRACWVVLGLSIGAVVWAGSPPGGAGGAPPPLPAGVTVSWWEEVQRGILAEEGAADLAAPPVQPSALASAPAWTASGDENRCYFGFSVAAAGDVNGDGYGDVIVGAPGYDAGGTNRGRAYLFLGSATGPQATPAWTVSGDQDSAQFGAAVATAGDVNGDGYSDVIVGAYVHDAGGTDRGRAYVFHGSASGLSGTANWTGSGNENSAYFGYAVAAAGDTNGDGYGDILVGAYMHNGGGVDRGQAYVYRGSSTGLSSTAAWTGSGDENSAHFGRAVATAGDVNGDGFSDIVVGAPDHSGGGTARGRIYVYAGSSGSLSLNTSLNGGEAAAGFGASVSTAGDVNGDGYSDILVGAPLANAGSTTGDRGQAFVYPGSSTGITTPVLWTGSGDEDLAQFGFALGTAGDTNGDGYSDIVVGAPYHNAGGTDRGRAYVYQGSSTGPAATAAWTASGSEDGANLGYSVFTAGDANGDGFSDLLVGASNHDAGAGALANRGQAYLYLGAASVPGAAATWEKQSVSQAGALAGCSVASAGDVNGDGYDDVILGAYLFGPVQTPERGKAVLYLGTPAGPSTTPGWIVDGGNDYYHFGFCVASAGDVNGDGYDDVIVGAPGRYVGPVSDGGAVFVYHGSASGLSTSPSWTRYATSGGDRLGYSVAGAGDVNGDGYADVIVGAPTADSKRVWVHLGSPDGVQESPVWSGQAPPGDTSLDYFGGSVASAGDVNGDGYSDIIIGAMYFSHGTSREGAAFVYHGAQRGPFASPAWSLEGGQAQGTFGYSVAGAGDVNGDGYSDVIVGMPGFSDTSTSRGKTFLYGGSSSGLAVTPLWEALGGTGEHFGGSVASAGDVNGDGYSDVLVGGIMYSVSPDNVGRASLFLGASSGPGTVAAWTAIGSQDGEWFGYSAASAGDTNGDGFSDLVIGAPSYDTTSYTDGGRVLVFCANGGSGVPLRPQQFRADESAPIASLGRAVAGEFVYSALGRTPLGRGDVKLEWQAVPLGTAFGSALSTMSRATAWTDSGLSGAALTEPHTLPGSDGPFCWRMRTLYSPATTPFQRHGIWLTPAADARRETDLRKTPVCYPPDIDVSLDHGCPSGADYTLVFYDSNETWQRTGWNVRRWDNPALAVAEWPLIAWNVPDENPGTTPQIEWTDGDCDLGAREVWYYQVTAYNLNCPAEGPF